MQVTKPNINDALRRALAPKPRTFKVEIRDHLHASMGFGHDLRASTHHHDPIFTPIFTSILGSSLFGFTGAALTNAVAIASALATTSITKGLQRT